MQGRELPPTTATPTWQEVADAFATACWGLGLVADHNLLAMLLAHSALETGHWQALRCFNFGNAKAHDAWLQSGGAFTYYEASEDLTEAQMLRAKKLSRVRTDGKPGKDMEVRAKKQRVINGKSVTLFACWFWASHPQARFRAWPTLEGGAVGYVEKLLDRYEDALEAAHAGDPVEYVRRIHAKGYFTANPEGYRDLVVKLFKQYRPQVGIIELKDPYEQHQHPGPDYCV